MAENHNLPFSNSISAARERLEQELRAQAEQIQKLHQELTELQSRHERTHSEVSRQLDVVADAGHAAAADAAAAAAATAATNVSSAAPDAALEKVVESVRALLNCASPEETTQTLSEQASRWGVRSAIFDVRGKSVWGAHAHGFGSGLSDGAFRSVVVQLTQDNPFRQLWDTVADVRTNAEALKKNRNVIEKLKPAPDAHILLLPIRSAGTVTAIFYADPGESGEELPVSALKLLAEFTGAQIDRLIALSGGAAEVFASQAAQVSAPIHEPEAVEEAAAPPDAKPEESAATSNAGAEAHAEVSIPLAIHPPAPEETHEPGHEAVPPAAQTEWTAHATPDGRTQEFPVPDEAVEAQSGEHSEAPAHEAVATESHAQVEGEIAAETSHETHASEVQESGIVEDGSEPAAAAQEPTQDAAQLEEAEQKAHKDAQRFAKLLVSEIELYNKSKVADGRQNGDLYRRLKNDIDRSRQTFDKRFSKGPVQQFDYFHDELVKILAQSDSALLGPEYPGPSV